MGLNLKKAAGAAALGGVAGLSLGAAGGLFGGKKSKGFDTAALQRMLNQGADKQAGLVQGGFNAAGVKNQDFERTQNALAQAFETGANQRAEQFGQQLQGIESPDFVNAQQAKNTELAFRNLPAAQQNIREQLGATGGLNRGVAIRALQQPVLQASQQAADANFQTQQQATERDIARRTVALDTIYQTAQGAALQKLGIDRETAQVLLENGRADILDRATALAGIESGRTQGLLDVEQLRQGQDIERAGASKARRAALLGTAGTLAGSLFGPVGGVIGGQVGSLAGGGSQPLDLTSLLSAMRMRQAQQASAQAVPIGPPRPPVQPTF